MSKKYINQEFDDEVRITSENPIYENCIFNEGVFIEGNVYPIFISCSFYGYDSAGVQLLNGSQGFFYNCRFNHTFPYISPNMKNCSPNEAHGQEGPQKRCWKTPRERREAGKKISLDGEGPVDSDNQIS